MLGAGSETPGDPLLGGIGFTMLMIAVAMLVAGIVMYSDYKRQWNLYYDTMNQLDNPDTKKRMKKKKISIALIVVSVVMIIVSFILVNVV